MNERERFHACLNYQPVDFTPFWSWAGWSETMERWKAEGFDEQRDDPLAGADRYSMCALWFHPHPPFENTVLSEDDHTRVYVNDEGIVMKELKDHPDSSMPQFLKFPVENRAEFRSFWSERMDPDLNRRVGPDWADQLRRMRAEPRPLIVWADRWGGVFGPQRNLVGVENLCTLFYDDPPFVEEMMDADADFIIAVMEQILGVVEIDSFWFWEDMAYKTAPLISPDMARQYMLPRYRRVNEFLRSRGVRFIGLDSDGYIEPLIPIWMDAGINCLFPFERQAGMDVVDIRRKYGKELRMFGGADKRALVRGPKAIDAELEHLRPLIEEGGYIPHTDHSCPPDISYPNYLYFMDALAKMCGKPAPDSQCS